MNFQLLISFDDNIYLHLYIFPVNTILKRHFLASKRVIVLDNVANITSENSGENNVV